MKKKRIRNKHREEIKNVVEKQCVSKKKSALTSVNECSSLNLLCVKFNTLKNIQYALRSKSKDLTIHKKKIKFNEKSKLTDTIVSCESRINHSQK